MNRAFTAVAAIAVLATTIATPAAATTTDPTPTTVTVVVTGAVFIADTVVRSDGRPGSCASVVKDVTGLQIHVS